MIRNYENGNGGDHTEPSPVDRRKLGSKHHLITDANGTPLAVTLIDAIPPTRGLVGKPRRRPRRLYADHGYDHNKYRGRTLTRGVTPLIARHGVEHGSGLGTIRWPVERTSNWLKNFRRLRIRTERRAGVHQAILGLACSMICLHELIPN